MRNATTNRSGSMLATLTLIVVGVVLPSCVYIPRPELKLYDGPERADGELAIIREAHLGCVFHCIMSILSADGEAFYTAFSNGSPNYRRTPEVYRLLPGVYKISLEHRARHIKTVSATRTVILRPGHTYYVRSNYCILFCFTVKSYSQTVWMEDASTGEVLIGTKW